jgi:hypothetical protein
MTENYFINRDVTIITLRERSETDYVWAEEILPKPKKFLGIKYDETDYIPGGWITKCDLRIGRQYRVQSNYFMDCHLIDEVNKKIYNRAYLNVKLLNNVNVGGYFDSNEEARKYLNNILETSENNFQVISG